MVVSCSKETTIILLININVRIMSQIKRYCVLKEEHNGDNAFRIHRGYIMGNPYTHIKSKETKAMIVVKTREEAIERYKRYFETSMLINPEFKQEFERMADACMTYDEVFLGCYCNDNESCHGDFLVEQLRKECTKRMVKKALERKKNN